MQHFAMCLVLACLAHTTVASRNLTAEEKASSLERLKAAIPREYYCCADGQFLDRGRNFTNFLMDGSTKCEDKSGVKSNLIAKSCLGRQAVLFEPELLYQEYDFYVENGYVIMGNYEKIKFEMYPSETCFGNRSVNNEISLMILLCDTEKPGADMYMFVYLSFVSIPFLVLTIVVYSLLRELRDVQGLSVVCMCSAFLVAIVMADHAILNNQYGLNTAICRAGGLLMYFSLMSSFFWMNAISIQGVVSLWYPKLAVPWRRQFLWYCGYAWGGPAVMLLSVLIAEAAPGTFILPGLEFNNACWFNGHTAKWAYFLGPLTALFVSSCLMYVVSAYFLFTRSYGTEHKRLRYKFMLSLRLFVVIGVTWLSEPLQVAHGKHHILWVITDCWNLLQGFFVFIVMVILRKRALRGLISRGYTFCLKTWLQTLVVKLGDEDLNESEPVMRGNIDFDPNYLRHEEGDNGKENVKDDEL